MLRRTKPPMPSRINDVGSGWAAAVIEVKRCVKVTVAIACETTPCEFNAPARATSPDAITAKTEIPTSARVSFIELTRSSLI